jgi:hypothetical protein
MSFLNNKLFSQQADKLIHLHDRKTINILKENSYQVQGGAIGFGHEERKAQKYFGGSA